MVDIKKAAEFLDSKVGAVSWLTADWRSKIDTKKLDMYSMYNSILGQLHGRHDDAHDDLELDSQDMEIRDSFCSGTSAWVNYLKENTHMHTVGTTLWGIHNKKKYTVLATYTKDRVRYYVISVEGSTDEGSIWSEDQIKLDWTTVEPKRYRKGDILALKGDSKGVYVLVGNNDNGVRIGNSVSGYTYVGNFSNAPMSEYTRFDYDIIGNITDVWAAGIEF